MNIGLALELLVAVTMAANAAVRFYDSIAPRPFSLRSKPTPRPINRTQSLLWASAFGVLAILFLAQAADLSFLTTVAFAIAIPGFMCVAGWLMLK
jgi:hypothetical protein